MALPNGKTAEWDFVFHKGAAAVVPVLPDGRILMVRQYRNALERYTLEIPAGAVNSVEEPKIECAYRELEEGMMSGVKRAMDCVIILLFVGVLIGAWIKCGTVPMIIYYAVSYTHLPGGAGGRLRTLGGGGFLWP